MRRIAYLTGLFGSSAAPIVPDEELFADLWTAAYTDGPTAHHLIATLGEETVGYLLGATEPAALTRSFLQRVAPLVASRAIRSEYRHLGASLPFLARLALEPGLHAPRDRYPAHLHVNLLEAARGAGLGRALLEAFLERLRAEGVPGVQLSTTDRNAVAVGLYGRLGFELFASRETRVYRRVVDGPVRRLVMVLGLESGQRP